MFIYILELENKKYYVGRTENPNIRINEHFLSNGSAWTRKYKPIKILEIHENCDNYDEDKYTIKCMEKYGINNVRGGSFCQIKLSDGNIEVLKQMINNVTDKCYICGNNGHYANECKKEEKIKNNENEKCDCVTSFFSPHRRKKCLLNKIITLFDDENDDIDKLKNINNKSNVEIKDTISEDKLDKNINNKIKEEHNDNNIVEKNRIKCYKCGRIGHYASSCYANTHIKGYSLKKH